MGQRTNFAFEILVHDDASTDGTAETLREYESRYDNVRVYYEEENQYGSAKYEGGYLRGLLEPEARGEYVALCEGDDFWRDPSKLQRQADYLDSHPGCPETCHAAIVVDGVSGEEFGTMGMGPEVRDLGVRDILESWCIPTASRMRRKGCLEGYADMWASANDPVGDFPTAVYNAAKGYIHYDPEPMGVYRFRTPGSWTSSQQIHSRRLESATRWVSMLKRLDDLTGGVYHEEFLDFAYSYAAEIAVQCGRNALTEYGSESFDRRSPDRAFKYAIKRILFRMGFTVETSGWGNSTTRRLVPLNDRR